MQHTATRTEQLVKQQQWHTKSKQFTLAAVAAAAAVHTGSYCSRLPCCCQQKEDNCSYDSTVAWSSCMQISPAVRSNSSRLRVLSWHVETITV